MAYGLTIVAVRRIAFDVAKVNKSKVPKSWIERRMADIDWLRTFMKRKKLSIRQPEACSLARSTSFKRHNVRMFFDNLQNILKKYPILIESSRVFNLDETSTKTVHDPKKVVIEKGIKQANSCISGEHGVLVTICCIISVLGTYCPPVMVFPRKFFNNGAPRDTLGLANPSGWMTAELFLQVLEHFSKYSSSFKENPSLLIFDNHESHVTVKVIMNARKAGVHILTLPPHCSNKLQPLDVAVFGPFKAYYTGEC
ncbi:uncharacterized protein [Diabrotica undecimpunctata]|uniref:uncharacterized protein n=1 Tax=Diabrotica undecimpunctata TaxID=50387 RepID=UPI003B63A4E1